MPLQAAVSSAESLLTLQRRDALRFVLEVAPVALVEAPLLLVSLNLRTTGGRGDVSSSLLTPQEAGRRCTANPGQFVPGSGSKKHEHSAEPKSPGARM